MNDLCIGGPMSIGWLVCSVIAYQLIRREVVSKGNRWTVRDRKIILLATIACGPLALFAVWIGTGEDKESKW